MGVSTVGKNPVFGVHSNLIRLWTPKYFQKKCKSQKIGVQSLHTEKRPREPRRTHATHCNKGGGAYHQGKILPLGPLTEKRPLTEKESGSECSF